MACALPLLMWLGYKEVKNQIVQPQAVLVLGGSTKNLEREKFTADFAKEHPNLPIWISGGSPPRSTQKVFTKAGVDPERLNLDYEAVDTVTNFTTLVDDLQARGIKSVYLITSEFHMRRACVIAEIVLGSRGIEFKAVPVPSKNTSEPLEKTFRDGARAILWLATGYTGAEETKIK
ncbi:YdcF family protein [Calothrix sp. FACHB-1219]|uniref:YdcF family protein n=1 Tax=unclassified Calothrix TaxID=2619626 RepID=UPI001686CF21|nr:MULTISPECIES: YdcF family protein [unclassified Calothrix]MBD2205414.1 YdcF family protein [Calothrix sp. FACHB-168]MBD2218545.1 YdcF family protein [Calothrix sp. FACHB-1219]